MVYKSMGVRLAKFYGRNFRDESEWGGEEVSSVGSEKRGMGGEESGRKLFGIEEEIGSGEVNELDV